MLEGIEFEKLKQRKPFLRLVGEDKARCQWRVKKEEKRKLI